MPHPRLPAPPSFPLLAALASLAVAGCASDEITVVVCGDVLVPDDIDAVRIELLDEALVRIREGVLQLAPRPGETGETLRLPVTPSLAAASGRGWVRAVGLKDQVSVVQFDREIYEFDDFDEVDTFLGRVCLRSMCPAGQTCIAGVCTQAPIGDAAPSCEGR